MHSAITASPGGVRLQLRIQPRASRSEVVGLHGDTIRIRLAAPPVDGAANEALVELLAERLGVARAEVRIRAGLSGRSKLVDVRGVSLVEAAQRLGIPSG
jgi:uncharacterized protein (TIGR00251 family)